MFEVSTLVEPHYSTRGGDLRELEGGKGEKNT